MRVFCGLLAFTLLFMVIIEPAHSEASQPPKPALNLKMRPDFMEKIRNLEFKGLRWDNLTSLMSKFKFKHHRADDGEEAPNIPNPSINEPLNATMIEELENTVFITQFFNFILTGRFDGVTIIGDDYDLLTLDAMLGLGIQLYVSIVTLEDPVPDYAFDVVADLERILELLRVNGSTAVFFKDLKPYLTYDTAFAILQVYIAFNQATWAERFQQYLWFEFLGGLGDGTCKIHSATWFNDFPAGEPWAILMFDALAKLPTGLSQGNINWMGSIDTCRDVPSPETPPFDQLPIKGKYCRADIGFPLEQFFEGIPLDDSFGLSVGMCVSHTCDTRQVKSLVSNSLKLLSAFKVSWVNQVECLEEEYELPTSTIVWTILLSVLVGFVIFCTIFDVILRIYNFSKGPVMSQDPVVVKAKEEVVGKNVVPSQVAMRQKMPTIFKFFQDCSIYTNTSALFRTDNGGKIACLNGIRTLSMLWIIFGHTFNYIANRDKFFLMDNIFAIQKLNEEWYAQIIINGVFGVDAFFLMSAFLLTMSLMNKLTKNGRLTPFEWAYYYIHRYWRLMPPLMIILIINIYVAPYMLSGPLLNPDTFPPYNEQCREYWWAFLIFLNNFIPDGRGVGCMSYLWYIPNDYQFYMLSPIIVYLLYKFPAAAYVLVGTLATSTLLILGFLSANAYVANGRYIIDVLLDMWVDIYIKPYCRGLPWLVGIILGYIIFKHKNIKINYGMVAAGWITSILLIISVLFGGFTNHARDARRMEVWEYAVFFSLTKLAWALALAWIIFACHYGYGGVINDILSGKAYIPLTRISFAAYLIHPTMMTYFYYLQEGLFHSTILTLVYMASGHIVMTFTLSYFYTLFFELPFVALERLVYDPRRGH